MSRARKLPKTGTVRYLHVSVQVTGPTINSPGMMTKPGHGATARKVEHPLGKTPPTYETRK